MKKRVISVMLAAVLVLGLIGCGAGNNGGTAKEESGTKTEENNGKKEPEDQTEEQRKEASGEQQKEESKDQSEEQQKEETGDTENQSAGDTADVQQFNYEPKKNDTGKEFRIAALTVQNNPFWVDVTKGIEAAKTALAGDDYHTTVDMITVDDFDGQVFAETIDTCIVKGYDAITTVGVSDAIVPAIDKATQSGIPVYVFNSDTEKESKRVAFVGQDLYAAGGVAADTAAALIGEKGKVGIITGLYSVNAHELRRHGIEDTIKESYPDIEIVGTTENHDSADEAYTQTKDFITGNPDLSAILVTAGGPHGAAKAIEELGMQDQIKLVCFDTTTEIVSYVRKGIINGTVSQDPFGQGADPIILAYNQLVTGNAEVTGNAFTKMDVITPENIGELFPE